MTGGQDAQLEEADEDEVMRKQSEEDMTKADSLRSNRVKHHKSMKLIVDEKGEPFVFHNLG